MLNRKTSNIKNFKFRSNFQNFAILHNHVVGACTVIHLIRPNILSLMDIIKVSELSLDCKARQTTRYDVSPDYIDVGDRCWRRNVLLTNLLKKWPTLLFCLPILKTINIVKRCCPYLQRCCHICKWRLSSKTIDHVQKYYGTTVHDCFQRTCLIKETNPYHS